MGKKSAIHVGNKQNLERNKKVFRRHHVHKTRTDVLKKGALEERKRTRKMMAEANITAAALKTQVEKSQREGNKRKDRKNIRHGGTQLEPTGVVAHRWSPQVWWHTAGAPVSRKLEQKEHKASFVV